MVVEIAPDPRQIEGDLDAEGRELIGRADARAQQQQRRADRAGGEQDTALRSGLEGTVGTVKTGADTAPLLQDQRQRAGLEQQGQIGSPRRRRQIGIGDGLALAIPDGEGVETGAGHLSAIVILAGRQADLFPRCHIGCGHGMGLARADQMEGPAVAVKGRSTWGVGLAADEIGQQVCVAPAGAAGARPAIEIAGMAANMGHGVDRRRAAEDPAPRPFMDAVCRMALGDRAIGPIDLAVLQQRPFIRLGEQRMAGRPAGLHQADPQLRILAETGGQDRAGGA